MKLLGKDINLSHTLLAPGVLRKLNDGELQPLGQRPDMIGQPRRHRWSPLLPGTVVVADPQPPHRPAKFYEYTVKYVTAPC